MAARPSPSPDEAVETDYYGTIETHFIERRGSPLFISPKEWALIRRWEELGIPSEVVCAALDEVFSRPKAYDAPRKLGYCRQTVEARFRRYCEAQLGSSETGPSDEPTPEESTPVRFLESLQAELVNLAAAYRAEQPAFAQALDDGVRELAEIVAALSTRGDDVEPRLKLLENRLLSKAELVFPADLEALREDSEKALGSYRSRMPADVYDAAVQSGYRRRLRRLAGLPTLSLFDR